MGRGKLKLELIAKEKSRNVTFKKRKSGLLKKAEEFSTLCGVDTCVIIFGPKMEEGPANLEIFPPDPNEVRKIIDKFKSKASNVDRKKTYDLSEYFVNSKKKVDNEIYKLRKANKKARFPSWDDRFDDFSSSQLRDLDKIFDIKLRDAKMQIDLMKKSQQFVKDLEFYNQQVAKKKNDLMMKGEQIVTGLELYKQQPISTPVKPHDMQLPAYCSCSQAPQMPSFAHNPIPEPMTMLMMNDDDYNPYGNGMSRSNFPYTQSKLPPYNEPMPTMLGNVVYNPRLLSMCYHGPTTQQTPPYEQQMMPNDSSQANASQFDEFYRDFNGKVFKHEDRV